MAIKLQRSEKDITRIVESIIQLSEGRQDSVGDVTLRANQTTTVVSFPNVSADARVSLEPRTANAAAARATTYVSNVTRKQFTITHANNAQTDRTFSFMCIGG